MFATVSFVTSVSGAPVAAGAIADQNYPQDAAITPLDISADFTGSGITYALAPSSAALPAGLSLSSAGLLTGTPTTQAGQVNIVVRGTNSGGFADTAFGVTIGAPASVSPAAYFSGTYTEGWWPTNGDTSIWQDINGGNLVAAISNGDPVGTVESASGGPDLTANNTGRRPVLDIASGLLNFDGVDDRITATLGTRHTDMYVAAVVNTVDASFALCGASSTVFLGFGEDGVGTSCFGGAGTPTIVVNGSVLTGTTASDFHAAVATGAPTLVEFVGVDMSVAAWQFTALGARGADDETSGLVGDFYVAENTADVRNNVPGIIAARHGIVLPSTAEFGALTRQGAGGIAVTGTSITSGDPSGHWQISGSVLSPSATGEDTISGTYNLTLNDASTVDITVVANKASVASAAELVAAYNALPASTATGILVRDGDYKAEARMTPSLKAFTNQMTIEPHTSFVEAANPTLNTHTVALPGLFLPQNTANVRLYGLEFYETLDGAVAESSGVVELDPGSVTASNIIIEACEVHSRSMTDAYDNSIIGDSTGFSSYASQSAFFSALNAIRGIRISECDNARVLRCHLHDLTRGITGGTLGISGGNRSRIEGNYILDVITNFTTFGGATDGLDIWDNRGLHTWGSDLEVPSNPLHGAVGLSFDPPAVGSRFQNVTVMGNIMSVGWRRRKYTEDSGDTYTATNASTGMKFNDPNLDGSNAASYQDITVAFNTLVTAGISIEFSGALNIDIYNNTLLRDTVSASGSWPLIYFQGSTNTRAWNNVAAALTTGSLDNTGFYTETLADFEGYGNVVINDEDYFEADGEVSYPYPEVTELETYYTPVTGRHALTATQKKGALGTGLYSGAGVDSVTYDPPTPAAGTPGSYDTTVWDGSTNYVSGMPTFSSTLSRFTCFFQVEFDTDGTEEGIFGSQFRCLEISRLATNKLYVYCKRADFTVTVDAESEFELLAADGKVSVAVTVDMDLGIIQMVKNGVQDRWNGDYSPIVLSETIDGSRGLSGFAKFASTSAFDGNVDFLWLGAEFFDLDDQTNIEALYDAAGAFQDFGADGSTPTGRQPEIFLKGNAAGFSNDGSGGVVTVNGTLSDAGGGGFAVDEGASGGTFRTSGGFRIWEADADADLVVTSGGTVSAMLVGGGAAGGNREGGGGGAGEFLHRDADLVLSAQTYSAVVGPGAPTNTTAGAAGENGSNTSFAGITVEGGNGGGGMNAGPNATASGSGGGHGEGSLNGAGQTASTSGSGLANDGGDSPVNQGGGGGGGSSAAGDDGTAGPNGGNGGAGTASPVPGDSISDYAGGGGGWGAGAQGTGSEGGGDALPALSGTPAAANTGSGGGGGSGTFGQRDGGAGASGRVVVWWPI